MRLQTETFTQRSLYRESFYTRKPSHTEVFTQRSLYTEKLLHAEAFSHRNFYTEKPFPIDPKCCLRQWLGWPVHCQNKLVSPTIMRTSWEIMDFSWNIIFGDISQIDPPNGDLTHSDPTDRSAHASSRTTRPPPFSTAGSRGLGLSHQRTSPPTCWLALDCHSTWDPLNPWQFLFGIQMEYCVFQIWSYWPMSLYMHTRSPVYHRTVLAKGLSKHHRVNGRRWEQEQHSKHS